ncbi:MAG: hypothetical protein WA641_06845, partial [Candidatus Acidiferrales bacterium]
GLNTVSKQQPQCGQHLSYRVNLIATSYPFPERCGVIIARESSVRKNKIGFTRSAASSHLTLLRVMLAWASLHLYRDLIP